MNLSIRRLVRLLLQKIQKKDNRRDVFLADYHQFEALNNDRFLLSKQNLYPCLDDKTAETNFDAHYIYHPAWAARIIRDIKPEKHIDISSTLHFCTILSAFVPTEFYDFRTAPLMLDNLKSMPADLTRLSFGTNSIASLSCMHTLEHIGLGRYGDELDPDGDIKSISELMRVCSIHGNLLIVVPVGRKKLMFNAHRIYDAKEFAAYFENFTMLDFALITDQGDFINQASFELAAGQNYGCGCYWFKKMG
jgi:hypothetical protein